MLSDRAVFEMDGLRIPPSRMGHSYSVRDRTSALKIRNTDTIASRLSRADQLRSINGLRYDTLNLKTSVRVRCADGNG